MTLRLAEAMRDHFARDRLVMYNGKRTPYVFHHTRTRRGCEAGDRVRSMRRAVKAAMSRAGIPPVRIHDLRHRRVTTWLAEGKPAALVQKAMGHATITTTMGYSHLAREHLRVLASPLVRTRDQFSTCTPRRASSRDPPLTRPVMGLR
jgi:integrase